MIDKVDVHFDYDEFLKKHHPSDRNRRATEIELGKFLHKYVPGIREGRTLIGGVQHRQWSLPSLETCRAAWLGAFGWDTEFKWEDEVET
jgi:hypothetical protein